MRSITTWSFEPGEPIALAQRFADLEGTILLYSGGRFDSAHSSYLCLFPEDKITIAAKVGCWEELAKVCGSFDSDLPIPKWVGYLGYEMGCFADVDREIICFPTQIPDALFYRPTVVIHFNHVSGQATLFAKQALSFDRDPPEEGTPSLKLGFCSDTLETYLEKIARIKAWIVEGEIYQVNLSQEFHLEGKSAPFRYFQQITALNPAPFSAYVQCKDYALVSSSPERFLQRKGTRLETRPIKGTFPRGKTPEEDMQNRNLLVKSEKERAELLMITDLMRNDVGKVSEPGSVITKDLWRIEPYKNVFHLLSIIEGTSSQHPISLIRQLFPGGSITGCPKMKAMEAITQLEKRPRSVYTGSIGYFAANGDFDFNIAIRTLVVHPTHLQIQLGGAIVIDSDPVKEFEETLHKGESLFNIVGAHALCLL